jgi:hypothetical protein
VRNSRRWQEADLLFIEQQRTFLSTLAATRDAKPNCSLAVSERCMPFVAAASSPTAAVLFGF